MSVEDARGVEPKLRSISLSSDEEGTTIDVKAQSRYHTLNGNLDFQKYQRGQQVRSNGGFFIYWCSKLYACGLNFRWILLSISLFLFGNVVYIYLAILDLKEDPDDVVVDVTSVYDALNFIAAILFIANPVSDFMQYWAEAQATEIIEEKDHDRVSSETLSDVAEPKQDDALEAGGEHGPVKVVEMCDLEEVNWDKWVAIIFLIGGCLALYQAYLDAYFKADKWSTPLDILISNVFVLDSVVCLIGWKVARNMNIGTSQERWLLSINPRTLDWSGWGDWLFFVGSVLDAVISFMDGAPEKLKNIMALVSSIFWMVDAVFYLIGYCYGQDVRRRFDQGDYTSLQLVQEEHGHLTDSKGFTDIQLSNI